ncbi:MAG: viral aspartic protease [Pararhodobacter sp.]
MRILPLLPVILTLSACGSGGPAQAPLPEGRPVEVAGFETYTTAHNGYSRVRRSYATTPEDAAALAAFEDADPSDPAGYRSLIALNESRYAQHMVVEVIAEIDGPDGRATRLLRLTVDQRPFNNVASGELIAATGQFYLRGANHSWVTIDGGPLLQGSDDNGLVNMVIDFDTESVSLNLRTGVNDGSDVRMEIMAEDVPLNIRTGAYGDAVVIQVWDPDSPDILALEGTLRGTLGGEPRYANDLHDLTTSGLYTADGVDEATGRRLRVDGVFYGMDPNALAAD